MPEVPALSTDAASARSRERTDLVCAVDHGDEECPGYPDAPEGAEAEQPGPAAPQVFSALTALMVVQTLDGQTVLLDDINVPVVINRPPTRDEMYGMLSTSLKDIEIAEAAAHSAQATIAAIEGKQQEALAAAQKAMREHQEKATNAGIEQEIARRGGMRQS